MTYDRLATCQPMPGWRDLSHAAETAAGRSWLRIPRFYDRVRKNIVFAILSCGRKGLFFLNLDY